MKSCSNVTEVVAGRADLGVCCTSGEAGSDSYSSGCLSSAGVLVIGDSLFRYAGAPCAENGATVDACPGAKIVHIKQKLLGYVASQPKLIFIHAGTNNLVNGYNGGTGYNGGWGKKAALHSMADLLSVAKCQFPESRIILSGVLKRGDISNSSI
ncbi:hypothetical protein J6590_094115 [Homalodisca vitripennis]|nr:hypothetical protein J6590_094115 [Homalodisca vitripennis]